jgi:hypothetical protein
MSSVTRRHVEQPIRDACGHRWRHAQRPVDLDEVVREIIDRDSGHVVLDLPAEAIRQARVAAHRRADAPILPFHERCADVLRVGPASDHGRNRADALRWAVAALVLWILSV